MSVMIPRFFRVNQPTQFDYSCIAKKYFTIKPSNGDSAANLNNGENITFSYEGQKKYYRLADPESGFFIRIGYRTKIGANRNREANITLANNWFGHLFSTVRFRMGSQDFETINDFGVVMDILNHLSGDEFKEVSGEDFTWIPDTSSGTSRIPFNVTNAAVAANTAVAANFSTLTLDNNYNHGFDRRMKKYNYTIDAAADTAAALAVANDTHRYVTAFIPLSLIFGCCNEDKLLRGINFEINLTRKQNTSYTEVFLGSNRTNVEFGDPASTGILNMSLRLVEYIPNPNLAKELTSVFTAPINWTYKQRHCIVRSSALDNLAIAETKQTVPQFIFIGCKGTTDDSNQKGAVHRNFSLFRHCNMKSIQVDLDGETYPNEPQNSNFLEGNYSAFYQQFRKACKLVGGCECSVSSIEYRDLYTIFAIDTTNKPMKLRNAVSNMVVNIQRNALPADNANPINPLNVDYYVLSINEKSYDINTETGEIKEVYI